VSLRADNPQKNLPLPGLRFADSFPNPQVFAARATKPDAAPLPPTPAREIQPPLRADGAASAPPLKIIPESYRGFYRVENSNPDCYQQAGLTEITSIPPISAPLDSRCLEDVGTGRSAGPPSRDLPLSRNEDLAILARVNLVCFGNTLFPLLAMSLKFIASEQLRDRGLDFSSGLIK